MYIYFSSPNSRWIWHMLPDQILYCNWKMYFSSFTSGGISSEKIAGKIFCAICSVWCRRVKRSLAQIFHQCCYLLANSLNFQLRYQVSSEHTRNFGFNWSGSVKFDILLKSENRVKCWGQTYSVPFFLRSSSLETLYFMKWITHESLSFLPSSC